MKEEYASYSEIKETASNAEILHPVVPQTGAVQDGLKVIFLLFRHKKFIIASVLIAMVIGAVHAFNMPNWYASTVSMVPPKRATSPLEGALGNLSSALKDIGMTKIGGKGEGYTYMVILHSRRLKDSLIREFNLAGLYDIPDSLPDAIRKELDENIEFTYETDGNYTITAWHTSKDTAALMANRTVEIANSIAREIDQKEALNSRTYLEQRLAQTDSALMALGDSLKTFTRETFLFSPQDQAKAASTAVAEIKAQAMQQEIILSLYRNSFGDDAPSTVRQRQIVNDLKSQINRVENEKGFAGNFALKDASEVGVRYLRFYTEFETFSKLKALLLPMLEQARLDERRMATTMYIMDQAVPADKKDRPKRTLLILGAGLGAFIFAVLFIILRYRYHSLKAKYSDVIATLKV